MTLEQNIELANQVLNTFWKNFEAYRDMGRTAELRTTLEQCRYAQEMLCDHNFQATDSVKSQLTVVADLREHILAIDLRGRVPA